jgi:hypothetical protein
MGIDNVIPILVYLLLLVGVVWLVVRTRQRRAEKSAKPSPPSPRQAERLPATNQKSRHTVFVSYRRDDSSDVTGRIYDRLVQHFGSDCVFKDVDSIPLGVDFRKHLSESVGRCDVLLAVMGKNWQIRDDSPENAEALNRRDFVRIEIESALQRGIPVIPVLVQGATLVREQSLPPNLTALAYYNAISVRPDPDFHQDITKLIRGIETHLR